MRSSHKISFKILASCFVLIVITVRESQSQRKIVLKNTQNSKFTAVLVQTRRKKIIKCCGVRSCTTRSVGNGTKRTADPKLRRNSTGSKNASADSGKATAPATYSSTKINPAGIGPANPGSESGGGGAGPEEVAPVQPELPPVTTTPAAVGYTGVTAGEDGDYGSADDPPANGGAPAAGGGGGGASTTGAAGATGAGAGGTGGTGAGGTGAGGTGVTGAGGTGAGGTGAGGTGAGGTGAGGTGVTGAGGTGAGGTGAGGTGAGGTGAGGTGVTGAGGTGAGGTGAGGTGAGGTGAGGATGATAPGAATSGGAISGVTATGATVPGATTPPVGNSTPQSGGSTSAGSNSAASVLNASTGNAAAGASSAAVTSSGSSSSSPQNGSPAATTAPGGSTSSTSQNAASNSGATGTGASSMGATGSSSAGATNGVSNSAVTSALPNSNGCKDDGCNIPCDKNPTFFPGGVLTVPAAKGTFYTICNKKYFYSNEKASQGDAHKACCAIGMALSSFETRAEQDCISNYNTDTLKTKAVYWLGATDFTCDKKFKWCISGEPMVMNNYDWIDGQPNYLLFNQHCMAHCVDYGFTGLFGKFNKGDDGLNDWECWEQNNYICEEKQ